MPSYWVISTDPFFAVQVHGSQKTCVTIGREREREIRNVSINSCICMRAIQTSPDRALGLSYVYIWALSPAVCWSSEVRFHEICPRSPSVSMRWSVTLHCRSFFYNAVCASLWLGWVLSDLFSTGGNRGWGARYRFSYRLCLLREGWRKVALDGWLRYEVTVWETL